MALRECDLEKWIPSPFASILAAGLAGFMTLLYVACSDEKSPIASRNKPDPGDGASETAPDAPASELTGDLPFIPGMEKKSFTGDLAPVMAKVDPGNDEGWDSEIFSAAAGEVLTRLSGMLSEPEGLTETGLDPLVKAKLFTCTLLRPESTKTVFSDATVTVQRQSDPGETVTGTAGLLAQIQALVKPLVLDGDLRTKFKIFRVGMSEEGVQTTDVIYQASGGGVQQNATWSIHWAGAGTAPKIAGITVSGFEEIRPGTAGRLRFADETEKALGGAASYRTQLMRGIDHWRGRLQGDFGVDVNGLQGIAVGDPNGDGLEDLYVCQQGGLPNRLYLRNADGTLRDASREAGVDWMELSRAALFVDLDNDGDEDLAIAQGWYLMLMENDGSAHFTERFEKRAEGQFHSLAAADYDDDGKLDLFFCGRNPLRERSASEGILGTPIPYHDANNGGPNVLLRNKGGWEFADVTGAVGLDVNNRRYSYACSWEDYDNDGDQDLYVANDYGRNNLYRNDESVGGGRMFRDVAAVTGVEDLSAGMSVTWGDYDRNGLMDVYVSNMFSSAGNRIAYQRHFRDGEAGEPLAAFRRHARGNSLFRNNGDRFEDVSVTAGVTMGRWAWGSKFADLNNDGWEDLYVANGFITTEDTGDL